jgi:methylated-DNA-[protein]-cysteine S-methyltransferase
MATSELERRLRDLGDERAPATLLGSVLARVRTAAGAANTYFDLQTEIGTAFVVHGPDGISAVLVAAGEEELWARLGRRIERREPPARLRERVAAALAGKPVELRFDLSRLTPFERDVLMKALEIPRGEVRTYGWIAREIGRPKAVRAVGTALAKNPIPLFIPCHRVVRSDGSIGQYGCGGPVNKRRLLLHEGVPEAALGRTLAV